MHNIEIASQKYSIEELKSMMEQYVDQDRIPKKLTLMTETTDFFRVEYNNVLLLGSTPYLIRNYEREGRFTIDEQPKFWVRRAIDLLTGKTKIIKMVFHENFSTKIGDLVFECIRSSKKEARILELVQDHPNFMQGFSMSDSAGNIVRIIDYIHGKPFDTIISGHTLSHEDYFYNLLPVFLDEYINLVEAINFLHQHGEKHGDIRRDHIIKNKDTGNLCWIDFDFNYWHKESIFGYDLFGLGNVLAYLVGKGDVTYHDLITNNSQKAAGLSADDMNIIFGNRVMNLKKFFPYIPDALNLILLHFSAGASTFYDNTNQFLADLQEIQELLNNNCTGGETKWPQKQLNKKNI